jgi:hypothetical protein
MQMYKKSHKIEKLHYGKGNFKLADNYKHIGIVYNHQGKLQESLKTF